MPPRTYSAFLSYSHDDNRDEGRRWAQWLQEKLENYDIPPDLVGTSNDSGQVIGPSLFPVFRDRLELRASARGAEEIMEALQNSQSLLVICSPRSAQKAWVQKEIVDWQKTERGHRVFPVLIDGDPLRDAFPPQLDPAIVIAADLRPDGRSEQGFTTAGAYRLKLETDGVYSANEIDRRTRDFEEQLTSELRRLVAGLLDISPGVLEQRDAKYRATRAEERAKEEEAKRIQIEQARDEALAARHDAEGARNEAEKARDEALAARGEAEIARKEAEDSREVAEISRDNAINSRRRYLKALIGAIVLGVVALVGGYAIVQEKKKAATTQATFATRTTLSLVDNLITENRPQEALARLADICRRYPDQPLAATRLFSLLSNREWALPLSPPVNLPDLSFKEEHPIERVRFSPDGRHALISRYTGDQGRLEVWNVDARSLVTSGIPCNSQGLEVEGSGLIPESSFFSPDSRFLASIAVDRGTTSTTVLTLLDLSTGATRSRSDVSGIVSSLRFTADSTKLLTGMRDGRLVEWDQRLEHVIRRNYPGEVCSISVDGNTALVSGAQGIQLYPTASNASYVSTLISDIGEVAAASPELDVVVIGPDAPEDDDADVPSHLKVWRKSPTEGSSGLEELPLDFMPMMGLSLPGKRLPFLGSISNPRLGTERVGVMLLEREGAGFFHDEVPINPQDGFHPFDAGFSLNHEWLATVGSDQTGRVWKVTDEEQNPLIIQAEYECSSIDLHPTARRCVIADDIHGSWRLWNFDRTIRPLEPANSIPYTGSRAGMAASDSVVVFGRLGNQIAYDLEKGSTTGIPPESELLTLHEESDYQLHSRKSGRYLVMKDNREVSLHKTSPDEILTSAIPAINGFARFSPDGEKFLTVSDGPQGRYLQPWNAMTGEPLGDPIMSGCRDAGFSEDAHSIWTLGFGLSQLSLFDLETRRLVFGPIEIAGAQWIWVKGGVIYALEVPWEEEEAPLRYVIPYQVNRSLPLLCDLAEAISSRKVAENGQVTLWPASKETFSNLAELARKQTGNDPSLIWAKWLLNDRDSELGKSLLKQSVQQE